MLKEQEKRKKLLEQPERMESSDKMCVRERERVLGF
jgi:hypothetical protein